jgi:hypothetical protein
VTTTSFSNTGLSAGTTYYYVVSAVNSGGQSANSSQATATTQFLPAASANLGATAVSSSQINLNWTDNSNNETQFRIERKTGAGSFSFLVNKGANVTTHNDTGLQPGTTYTYRVRAENGNGNSAWSNEASATTSSGGSGPLVSNLTVASGKAYQWFDLAAGELVYIDRAFTYQTPLPVYVAGAVTLRTANDDKLSTAGTFVTFQLSRAGIVYVAHDDRITTKPAWMSGFTDTGANVPTTDQALRVWAKDYAAGTVTLGGNVPSGWSNGGISMYTVVVRGAFQESSGEVVMEGEHFHGLDGRTDPNAVNWQVGTAVAGSVGGAYVETPGPQGANGSWSDACETSYKVNFTTTGTYNVWVRRYAANQSDNSVFAGLDGGQTSGTDNLNSDFGVWVWRNLGAVSVTSAGVKTFQLRRREAAYKVDRIILRTSSATPSGNGPAESPQ